MVFDLGAPSSKNNIIVDGQKLENKFKAVIVDDNPINRKIMRFFLNKSNVETVEVVNGKEVVELFLAGANFDIILMDNEMPVMDGPQATRILREMGVRAKIVGMSGYSGDKVKQEFIDAGVDEFHFKPITMEKIESIIEKL